MFTQIAHPFYKNLLENDYTIIKSDKDPYFEWICGDLTLLVSIRIGMLSILDLKNDERAIFPHINIYGGNDYNGISEVIKEYAAIVRQSLNVKNIDVMNLILCEIVKNYPDVEKLNFDTYILKNKKILEFEDQNREYYKIIGKNIFDYIHNFCFIKNLQLSFRIQRDDISSHELLENFMKYKTLKKELLINPKIKRIEKM